MRLDIFFWSVFGVLTRVPGLTLTARSEAQVAAYSGQRPSTASSATSTGALAHIIPPLLTAMEEGETPAQDAFQANVCLGWVHYVSEEPGLAAARLPRDFGAVATQLAGEAGTLSGWSRVCLVKGTYLKGMIPDSLVVLKLTSVKALRSKRRAQSTRLL